MKCKTCGKELGADNWEHSEVVKTEPGSYFATPKRTWRLTSPGIEAYMIDDVLYCTKCYQEAEAA